MITRPSAPLPLFAALAGLPLAVDVGLGAVALAGLPFSSFALIRFCGAAVAFCGSDYAGSRVSGSYLDVSGLPKNALTADSLLTRGNRFRWELVFLMLSGATVGVLQTEPLPAQSLAFALLSTIGLALRSQVPILTTSRAATSQTAAGLAYVVAVALLTPFVLTMDPPISRILHLLQAARATIPQNKVLQHPIVLPTYALVGAAGAVSAVHVAIGARLAALSLDGTDPASAAGANCALGVATLAIGLAVFSVRTGVVGWLGIGVAIAALACMGVVSGGFGGHDEADIADGSTAGEKWPLLSGDGIAPGRWTSTTGEPVLDDGVPGDRHVAVRDERQRQSTRDVVSGGDAETTLQQAARLLMLSDTSVEANRGLILASKRTVINEADEGGFFAQCVHDECQI